jgi:hypothetical protein
MLRIHTDRGAIHVQKGGESMTGPRFRRRRPHRLRWNGYSIFDEIHPACGVMAAALCMAQPRGVGSPAETTRIINDCERRTNSFKKTLDRALARDDVRAGQYARGSTQRQAKRLEDELDRVGDSWNRDHNPDRTRDHVRWRSGWLAISIGRCGTGEWAPTRRMNGPRFGTI